MSIQGSREPSPPPPLPPPRRVKDIEMGQDLGWQWGNPGGKSVFPSASVPSTSSLHGTVNQPQRESEAQYEHRKESEMLRFPAFQRRKSSEKTSQSIPSIESFSFAHSDEGYGSLSGSSLAYQSVFPPYIYIAYDASCVVSHTALQRHHG